jgi:hypothetical protein
MNLIIRASGGRNIVLRPQARPAFYSSVTVKAAQVEVYWRYEGEPASAARFIGLFQPGQQISLPYNPLVDRNIILSTVSISAAGVRSVRDLRDAAEQVVAFQRETAAPTVAQVGAATHTLITLAIDGFSSLAFKRKVRTADDEAMTTNLSEDVIEVDPAAILPRVLYLSRPDPGSGARTIWVRVSHSSGGDFGSESTAQAFTWADSGGSGGGSGSGDPFGGGDPLPCFSGNVRIVTPGGFASFDDLRKVAEVMKAPFFIANETGRHLAELIIHQHDGPMIDMGPDRDGNAELVTLEHPMKAGMVWISAAERFPGRPRVHFKGDVYNLHILSHDERDHHYCLENGEVAHNVKPEG